MCSVLARVQRVAMSRLERSLVTGQILPYLITAVAVLAVLFAVIMRLVDREDFPSLGLALWWSVQTVTTVGYGDATPVQPFGRAVAAVLMVLGFASLSLLAGIIASALIARRRASEPNETLVAVERMERRLDEIERLVRER
jgi:voltage-gated potassium channel